MLLQRTLETAGEVDELAKVMVVEKAVSTR